MMEAIVPCAGLGRTMQPWSLFIPKELLPLGKTTCLHMAINELVNVGVRKIIIVWSAEKVLVKEYCEHIRSSLVTDDVEFVYIQQDRPTGSASAICLAMEEFGLDTALVAYPDQLNEKIQSLRDLCDAAAHTENTTSQIVRIAPVDTHEYSPTGEILRCEERVGRVHIEEIRGPSRGEEFITGARLKVFGRLVVTRQFVREYQAVYSKNPGGNQVDDLIVLQRLASRGVMDGIVANGRIFNLGNWGAYYSNASVIFNMVKMVGRDKGPNDIV